MRLPLLALLLCSCAAGTARIGAGGICEASGIALGQSSIVAQRVETRTVATPPVRTAVDPQWVAVDEASVDSMTSCAEVHGGVGSSGLWGAIGVLAGILASLLVL